MKDLLSNNQQEFLFNNGLQQADCQSILSKVLGHAIDSADLYFEASELEAWTLEDSIVKSGRYQRDSGVGIRAIAGEKTGLAYSQEFSKKALQQAAGAARSIASHGQIAVVNALQPSKKIIQPVYQSSNPIHSLASQDKVDILHQVDKAARELDDRVIKVSATLASSYSKILVMSHDGQLAADIRPMARLMVSVIVQSSDGRIETGSYGGGGRVDYSQVTDAKTIQHFCKEAVRQATTNLEAIEAPAGQLPVVLGPGWPGVLLHEAVGHGLEADFNRKGSSAFSGKIGQQVASKLCTVVDDGTLQDRRGSLTIDDEGIASQNTMLIENGILKGYMYDKHNAKLMGVESTGNGRRESYSHMVMPRMTNTYMLNGPHKAEEIIQSVKKGIYAVNFGGGQVDITSGKFVFSANEAYLIENGKVTAPIKGATLIGNGPEAMHKISMVADDMTLDNGVGVCGKDGQRVPVGVGQPTLKIDEMTVGGTNT